MNLRFLVTIVAISWKHGIMNATKMKDAAVSANISLWHGVCRATACMAGLAIGLENWRRREQLSMQLAHIDTHTLRDAGISDAQRFLGVHHPFDQDPRSE